MFTFIAPGIYGDIGQGNFELYYTVPLNVSGANFYFHAYAYAYDISALEH